MIIYNKLVRDRIPEIIQEPGEEELKEYLAASKSKEVIEELADLLEVIYGLAQCHGFSIKELETVRQCKKYKKGAFDKRLFLVEVQKKD